MNAPYHGSDRVGAGKKSGDFEVCDILHHLDVYWRYLPPGVCAKFLFFSHEASKPPAPPGPDVSLRCASCQVHITCRPQCHRGARRRIV